MSSRRTNLLLRQMAAVFQYSARVAGDPAGSAPPAERHQLFYRAVMEASPLAMALANFELRLLSVNPAFEALFGYRRADIVGASLPILVNREATLAEAMGEVRRTVTEGFAHAAGFRRRQDGSTVAVELAGLRASLGGGVEAVVMLYEDISEQQRTQEWLRLLQAAAEAAANAIVVCGRGGEILWVNPAFTRLTGYTPEEAVGHTTRLLKSGRHDEAFYRSLWGAVLAGEMWHGETVNRRKDGSLYVEDQTIAPVRNERGEITNFISIKEDVSARKEAETELQQAKEAAEAANRAKSTFLANMGHELRTPLNHIIGYAEMLAESAAEQSVAQDLQAIDGAAHQLLAVISDVLDLSKLETGLMEFTPATFDPAELMQALTAKHAPAAHKTGNRLALQCPPTLGALHTDQAKVRQVLDNLLSNACKFTRDGVITLSAERTAIGRAEWVKFTVADTGIGIPPDKLDLIFQPFTQVDASTTRRYGGSGLGLAVARKFCELMGGEISLTSAVGQGTTFTVLLPARAAG